jgi:hypothetical protein
MEKDLKMSMTRDELYDELLLKIIPTVIEQAHRNREKINGDIVEAISTRAIDIVESIMRKVPKY